MEARWKRLHISFCCHDAVILLYTSIQVQLKTQNVLRNTLDYKEILNKKQFKTAREIRQHCAKLSAPCSFVIFNFLKNFRIQLFYFLNMV